LPSGAPNGPDMPERSRAVVNAGSPPPTWSRTFQARPDRVPAGRRFLGGILDGFPLASDALLCLSELVGNAVLHSNSRRPGGTFTVRASAGHGRLRVEVEDQGGPWRPSRGPDGQGGRGLLVVGPLTPAWGVSGNGTPR